jgi:hypothetical protein
MVSYTSVQKFILYTILLMHGTMHVNEAVGRGRGCVRRRAGHRGGGYILGGAGAGACKHT